MADKELLLNIKADVSDAAKGTKEVSKGLKETNKEAEGAIGNFQIMGVSLNGIKKSFSQIIPIAKSMFRTITAGIMSTGIGALVIAVTSLITYFTNTKRGADKLAQAFTAMGAVVDVLKDRISKVGEALSFVFSGEFRKAGEALKGTFSGIADEVEREVKAMVALKKRTQELRDADNEFMVQKALTRREIEAARLIAEDETKSAQERLINLKKALELEAQTTAQELELAKERMKIQEEEMALSENSAEDERELAELRARVIETETASLKMRRRVVTEVNALEREIAAEEKARAKEKADALALIEKERLEEEKRIADEKKKADEKRMKEEFEKAKKLADDKIALEKLVEQEKQKTIEMGFTAAAELAGENDAASKAVAVAQTIYNTQQAIMNAMANVPAPFNAIQAVATGVMGASAIKKILSTSPSNASGGSGSVSTPSVAAPRTELTGGAFTLGGGIEPEPARAFVVSDDITNSQNKLANIRRRATI
tara:strand:+ start:699 stop:2159 length:1461 start_codon:yes stop_codon:yes gene_type:complete